MLTGSACPEELELRRLMLGEVSEQDTEALAEHLRECARGAETVRNLQSGDTLADALRGGQDGIADAADHARVSELIE
jgi:anti-sigma factor RsiW